MSSRPASDDESEGEAAEQSECARWTQGHDLACKHLHLLGEMRMRGLDCRPYLTGAYLAARLLFDFVKLVEVAQLVEGMSDRAEGDGSADV